MPLSAPIPPALIASANVLEEQIEPIVSTSVKNLYALHAALREKNGLQHLKKYQDACTYHLKVLVAASRLNMPMILTDYLFRTREMQGQDWIISLDQVLDVLAQEALEQMGEVAWAYIRPFMQAGRAALAQSRDGAYDEAPHIQHTPRSEAYVNALLRGDQVQAQQVITDNHHAGIRSIYLDIFQPALVEIGRLWEAGTITVAHEHMATVITQTLMSALQIQIPQDAWRKQRVIVACIQGNTHHIGPRMVADFLQLDGYETRFLGADVPEESLLLMIQEYQPHIVALSSPLSWQMDQLRRTVMRIRSDFASQRPTLMVGGSIFNRIEGLWKRVGADVWGRDAAEAVQNLENLG